MWPACPDIPVSWYIRSHSRNTICPFITQDKCNDLQSSWEDSQKVWFCFVKLDTNAGTYCIAERSCERSTTLVNKCWSLVLNESSSACTSLIYVAKVITRFLCNVRNLESRNRNLKMLRTHPLFLETSKRTAVKYSRILHLKSKYASWSSKLHILQINTRNRMMNSKSLSRKLWTCD